MTFSEPEQLALRIQRLIERRTVLRGFLEQAIKNVLTAKEREDIRHVIDLLDTEIAELERQLRSLQPGAGKTP